MLLQNRLVQSKITYLSKENIIDHILHPWAGKWFHFENWWTWTNYLEICSRIVAISPYSNEIEIGSQGSFFKNPPDGAEHSLKCIESRNRHHFDFKNFLRLSTLLLYEKKYLLVIKHRKGDFVIFLRNFWVLFQSE